jgi:small subunit ribosomal protein S14
MAQPVKEPSMARKGLVEKNNQRQQIVDKYAEKRRALKAAGDYHGLQNLPRDASRARLKNTLRCDGRARGYLRDFGVSRIVLRAKRRTPESCRGYARRAGSLYQEYRHLHEARQERIKI